jgi:hypothetical protein
MGLFDNLFGRSQRLSQPAPQQRAPLRAVPGALSYSNKEGAVLYNMLTPHMQQFMGRCVSAIKKAGIAAKGTGQFSILVGERRAELRLDKFYQPEDNPKLVEDVVHAVQQLNGIA